MFRSAPRRALFDIGLAKLVVLVGLGLGCSSGGQSGSCPDTVPTACPSPAPHFAADVAPLLQAHCTSCHGPGQQSPTLGSYANLADISNQQHVFFRLQYCTMPPPPKAPLTAQQRDTILSWIVCGAMND